MVDTGIVVLLHLLQDGKGILLRIPFPEENYG
jgi:hypothetical protein